MKIAAILAKKAIAVHTVTHDQTINAALSKMHAERIGSIIVVHAQTGALLGVISQSEILEGLSILGSSGLDQYVTGIMRRPAPTCDEDERVETVMRRITNDRCRHVVVTDHGQAIIGVVSLGDLVAAQLAEARLETGVLRDMARSHLLRWAL